MVAVGVLLTAGMSSCGTNRYRSPAVDTADLYRDTAGDGDTTTIADIPWASYFTDADLQQLIEEGVQANFDLRTALLRIQEAEAGLQVARAACLPVATVTGQVTHTRTSVQDGVTRSLGYAGNQYRLGIAVQWEVDLWGKLNRQARARYAQYLNSYEYKRLIQTSLVSNIAASYYTLMALDEQLRISRETVRLLEESAASMQSMMDAGLLNAAAVEQSRALLYATQVSTLNLEVSIRKLENSLSVVLGRKPGAIVRQAPAGWTAPATPLPYGVPAQMLARRPDVRAAELQFRTAFELRNAAQAALYPSLTLNTGTMAGYSATALTDFFKPANLLANIIGGLTQPVFAGNQLRAQVKITKAQEEEALLNFEKTVLTAAREVSDVIYTYEKALEKSVYRTSQTESLEKSVYYTRELLKAGEATYIEVLTAQQNYLTTRLAAVTDQLEKAQAVVDLYRALGGGD
ncbi:MAG: efflux transporter outer membrane subunit [Tannerella sp.]|nr:efflux transporter outer membrane subunit [Tannerella sp.]